MAHAPTTIVHVQILVLQIQIVTTMIAAQTVIASTAQIANPLMEDFQL